MPTSENLSYTPWSEKEKIAFRFACIFFIILSLPLDYKFYKYLLGGSWLDFEITDLLSLASYLPDFFTESQNTFFGVASFSSWFFAAGIAAIGSALWSVYDKRKQSTTINYEGLYYWLRVLLRYRLGIAMLAYGFIKLFPLQMPVPSLSNLHTNYGDLLPWKVYFHTIGLSPSYESFFGFVEILAGVLLFSRNKVTFGTGILLGFTGNIVAANFAYNIGSQVFSTYLVLAAIFLFAHDIPRLYSLLSLGKFTEAERFEPDFSHPVVHRSRAVLKTLAYALVILFFISSYSNFKNGPYLIPKSNGLANAFGFYNVKHFTFNNDTIPYSNSHPDRWQNVVFERWSTLSIKTAKTIEADYSVVPASVSADINRTYESAGTGDRRYFHYTQDSVSHCLSLQNKNPNNRSEQFDLSYSWLNDSTIVLKGINEKKDTVTAVLERINRKYMLLEGRRKPVRL